MSLRGTTNNGLTSSFSIYPYLRRMGVLPNSMLGKQVSLLAELLKGEERKGEWVSGLLSTRLLY